ncbi:MAG: hypothetical protein M3458_24315 [Acidobacteriota bacterium]|nr:hypothetical protein [Acidobacteriota bacterium]
MEPLPRRFLSGIPHVAAGALPCDDPQPALVSLIIDHRKGMFIAHQM